MKEVARLVVKRIDEAGMALLAEKDDMRTELLY
jgi:hypothetical protein